MAETIEVSIQVKRGKGDAKTYKLNQGDDSKKGTFKVFTPAGDNPDMPNFSKLYIKTKRSK